MYFPFIVMQKKKKKIMFVPLLRYVYVGGFNTLWQWLFISEIYKAIRISCNFFFNFFLVFIHKYQMIFNLLEDNYYYYCIYIKEGLCKKE